MKTCAGYEMSRMSGTWQYKNSGQQNQQKRVMSTIDNDKMVYLCDGERRPVVSVDVCVFGGRDGSEQLSEILIWIYAWIR